MINNNNNNINIFPNSNRIFSTETQKSVLENGVTLENIIK